MSPKVGDLVIGKVVDSTQIMREGGKDFAVVEVWGDAKVQFPHDTLKRRVLYVCAIVVCAIVVLDAAWMWAVAC